MFLKAATSCGFSERTIRNAVCQATGRENVTESTQNFKNSINILL